MDCIVSSKDTDFFGLSSAYKKAHFYQGFMTRARKEGDDVIRHEEYFIRQLDGDDLTAMQALQKEVLEQNKGQPRTFVSKTEAQMQAHFDSGQPVLGTFLKGTDRLIGMAFIGLGAAQREQSLTTVFGAACGTLDRLIEPGQLATSVGCVIVSPTYRGNNLQGAMMSVWTRYARKAGYDFAFARVLTGNTVSLSNFLREGFVAASLGESPHDGAEVYNLFKPLQGKLSWKGEADMTFASLRGLLRNHMRTGNFVITGFCPVNADLMVLRGRPQFAIAP